MTKFSLFMQLFYWNCREYEVLKCEDYADGTWELVIKFKEPPDGSEY